MVYQPGALDAALAAAVGEDSVLLEELRAALGQSASRHADLLGRARCDANWHTAAWRLKGLAASFGALDLLTAAEGALEAAPGDPVALRQVRAEVAKLST